MEFVQLSDDVVGINLDQLMSWSIISMRRIARLNFNAVFMLLSCSTQWFP